MVDKGAPLYVRVLVIVVIIFITFFLFRKQRKDKAELQNKHRFVVGITDGATFNHPSSTRALHYSFRVNGIKYGGVMELRSLFGIKTKGGEYIVMFDPKSPKNSELLLDKPVIFHPAVLEDTGWIIVPDYILHYRSDSLKTPE